MVSTSGSRVLLVAVVAVAAVGVLDAGIGRAPDLVVLFGLVAALTTAVLIRSRTDRRDTTLRHDLWDAVHARSQRTGEPLDQLTDRLVADALDRLDGRWPTGAGPSTALAPETAADAR
jgi:Flp pilus assembly protein TadB